MTQSSSSSSSFSYSKKTTEDEIEDDVHRTKPENLRTEIWMPVD